MTLDLNLGVTLGVAIVVLLAGRWVIARVRVLHEYSIPEPVVGGLLAAALLGASRFAFDLEVNFDLRLQDPLILTFFATIGLGADVRTLAEGGRKLVRLLAVVVLALLLQNALGVGLALAMDLNPLMGLLGGSVTLAGGHGTGAVYGRLFGEVNNLQGSVEVAMACATVGLVLGGVVGGPVARWLIHRHDLAPAAGGDGDPAPGPASAPEARVPGLESFLQTLLVLIVCLGIGSVLSAHVTIPGLTLPTFVWCLLTGIALRNLLQIKDLYHVDLDTVNLLGTVCLALFLSTALMTLRLWELVDLALPVLLIVAAQALMVGVFAATITFRAMGRDYDAGVIAAGHCGFQLGATPTAIANMQAVTRKYGVSPLAFLLVPIIGAFLIDLCNAFVIQAYLALPVFGF